MRSRMQVLSALVAVAIGAVGLSSTAHAANLSKVQLKCQKTIGKEGAKFVNGQLKARQKCINSNLKHPGSCTSVDVTKLETKLASGIGKACDFGTLLATRVNLGTIGFPGACSDANTNDGFSLSDLQICIKDSHAALVTGLCTGGSNSGQSCSQLADCPDTGPGTSCNGLIPIEYDSTIIAGPLTGTALKCQTAIAKNEAKLVAALLKNLQKCRLGLLDCKTDPVSGLTSCKLSGFQPQDCATADPKTAEAIAKARAKTDAAIAKACSDVDTAALKVCEPDQVTTAAGATCESDFHTLFTDNLDQTGVFDLLDYEFALRGVCGDNRKNQGSEECDGTSDAACPGQCGAPLGFFPCLCLDIPRTRVVEHAEADLDNGWTGQSHDSGIVEGGGYVTDLFDCDGPGGPDTLCNVGPTCSLPPYSPCSPAAILANGVLPPANADTGDEICNGLGQGTCRITAGGLLGPHCELSFKRCKNEGQCDGERCIVTPHGAPLPLSSGGVSVCIVNLFTEDVVGTTDLATGAGSVRLRQSSTTILGEGQQPCPVCGGFCSGSAGEQSPGQRNLCTTNADCTGPNNAPGSTCVTDSVCSYGPGRDKPCRGNPPFGGPTEFFGNPSVDCPAVGSILGELDILFNPASTNTVTLTANVLCNRAGLNGKTCAGGPNQSADCLADSECPGGTCNNQCFCGGGSQAPNDCQDACVGGPDDAAPCVDDSECGLPGFCHVKDCRPNPGDTDSAGEGQCTVGPGDGHCSTNAFVSCTSDLNCAAPNCTFCDPGETCQFKLRDCFTSPAIFRAGSAGIPDRTSAAIFCIRATTSAAVNNVAGLPGPGAITNPTTVIDTGF